MTKTKCVHCGKSVTGLNGPCKRCNRGIGIALKDVFHRMNKTQVKILEDSFSLEVFWSKNYIYIKPVRGHFNYVIRYDRRTGKLKTFKPE